MKIIQLKAANIKNLRAIDIKPDGKSVVLRGKNAAGKSAVLDSIFMALTGKKVAEPIRKGQKRGEIRVDLGECEVRRTFTDKGAYLEVLSKDGASFKSPQTMLDKILGELSFDPLAFATEKPANQRGILMSLAGLDFADLDKRRQETYDQRTLVNRQLRDVRGVIENVETPPEDLPSKELSISEAAGKVGVLMDTRNNYERWWASVTEAQYDLDSIKRDVEAARTGLESAKRMLIEAKDNLGVTEAEAKEAEQNCAALSNQKPNNPTDAEIEDARQAITSAEQTNIQIRKAAVCREQQAKAESLESLAEKMTDGIQSLDDGRVAKISAAKYPIDGLGIDEKQVLYRGLPLSQLSSGEQIKVSTAVAMALNPKLRVLCVREGSLLDADGLKAIQQQAKEKDYQLWIEVVGEKGVGILIQEGEIKTKKGNQDV